MAEANMSAIQDHVSCPVCLDLLKDPVTILCGHSFCMVCINDCWDQEDQKGVYSCPQCRQTFTPRPVVIKNTMLADVVETLKKTGLQATRSDHCSAGPEDVECDSCTERKSKAVKSCLVCLASFCETHLQPHYKSPAFKKHKLVEVSRRLQEQICSKHDKLLEVYCRTDQQCICMFCMLDKHKGHDTVSAAAGRPEKQGQVLEVQQKYKQEIQAREWELQDLTKAVEFHKRFAQTAMQRTERFFTELIKSIKRRHCEVTDLIRAQEKAEVSRAEKIIKQLEQEIAKLKTRDTELEELSHTQDHIHFLQSFGNLVTPSKSKDTIALTSLLSSERVVKSVSQLQEKLDAFFKDQFEKMSSDVKKVLNFSPQSRKECLQYFCQLSLDPITADQRLQLSDSNRMVTYNALHGMLKVQHPFFNQINQKNQPKDENTERLYPSYSQVLCKESVCEPCYWEVECRGFDVSIAVAYKDIFTKESGYECAFGRNDKSWNLLCSSSGYSFLHNSQETKISIKPSSSRIGVFVDQKAGILSFYSVSDTIKLLHRVLTTFTQPLYPGFTVNCNSTLKLCHSG